MCGGASTCPILHENPHAFDLAGSVLARNVTAVVVVMIYARQ